MTIENFNKTVKKLLPMIFVCTIGIGLVSIPSAHAEDPECRRTVHLENFNATSNIIGNHVKMHVFGIRIEQSEDRYAWNKSMYGSGEDWNNVVAVYLESHNVDARVESKNFAKCSRRPIEGKYATDEFRNNHLEIMGFPCAKDSKSKYCLRLGNNFFPDHYRFVYKVVNGEWVLNTAFPSERP